MDKYILQKDLPQCKAGTVFIKYSEDAIDYLARGIQIYDGPCGKKNAEFFLHDKFVEDNPEWFKKEPELKWFVVPSAQPSHSCIAGWTAYKQHTGDMGGYAGTQYFDTEAEANEWIIMNKPCLSLNDIFPHTPGLWYGVDRHRTLKELVKTKL